MAMDKIPQECRNLIGSFLKKKDRLNLALASKRFYYYFNPADWRHVTLEGETKELYRKLEFFLDENYATKYSLIRSVRISFINVWDVEPPPIGLAKRLVDSLSRMTCVRFIALHVLVKEDAFDFEEFTRGMAAAPRWDKVTYLSMDCHEAIAAAALDRCELDVLAHVTLCHWCLTNEDDEYDDLMYQALKTRYSAQPHLLKSLNIHFPYPLADYGTWDLIHEQASGVHQIIEDFPSLDYLRISNEAYDSNPTSDDSSWQEFEDGIEELCKTLNNSTIKDFTIEIHPTLVDRDFVARGLQEILPDDYPDYFDNDDYLEETDEEFGIAIDNWFFQLAKRIGIACPHFRSVTVPYGNDNMACFERIDDMTFRFILHGALEIWPGDGGLCE